MTKLIQEVNKMSIVINTCNSSTSKESTLYREDGSVVSIIQNESIYISEEQPFSDDDMTVAMTFDITKTADKGLVSGWASVSINRDGSIPLDWQDDVIDPYTLEEAAINFMQDYRESGVMHMGDSQGIVVESIVFTKEKQEAIGIPEGAVPQGWFITVKVTDPELFNKVKSGEYRMFSIQGKAKRVEL